MDYKFSCLWTHLVQCEASKGKASSKSSWGLNAVHDPMTVRITSNVMTRPPYTNKTMNTGYIKYCKAEGLLLCHFLVLKPRFWQRFWLTSVGFRVGKPYMFATNAHRTQYGNGNDKLITPLGNSHCRIYSSRYTAWQIYRWDLKTRGITAGEERYFAYLPSEYSGTHLTCVFTCLSLTWRGAFAKSRVFLPSLEDTIESHDG